MSFDFSTLITNRTNNDVSYLSALMKKSLEDWTPEELEQFNSGMLKGGYWCTDLNRVTACMEYLNQELKKSGYESGYSPIIVHPDSEPVYDENTLLLLHGEDLTDSSIYAVPLTNNEVQVSSVQSKFGSKSLYFNGTASLQMQSDSFVIGSSDLTVDWWEYRISNSGTSASINLIDDLGYSNFLLRHQGTLLYSSSGGTSWDVVSGPLVFPLIQNQWVHTAVVKSGSEIRVYINGSIVYSYTGPLTYSGLGRVLIGRHGWNPPSDYFTGYIDEFRISNVARWTSDFTPPTEPYEVETSAESKDPYIWYKEDVPTNSHLDQYAKNLRAIRSCIPVLENTPEDVESMEKLTITKANNIEKILLAVENSIDRMRRTIDLGWAMGIANTGLYGSVNA